MKGNKAMEKELNIPPLVFHQISRACYIWMQKQPNVKEESLTDWMLYNVSEKCKYFYYKTFSKNEEAYNGADWEWWVLTENNGRTYAYRYHPVLWSGSGARKSRL